MAGWGPGGMETGHGTEPSCSDADAAVPILITQGTADTTVTPDNGQNSLAFWLGRDGCSDTTTPVFNGCVAYQGCTSGLAVDFCSHGGGHEVPGAAPGNIWSFFSQYIAN